MQGCFQRELDGQIEVEEAVENPGGSPVLRQTRAEIWRILPQGIVVIHDVLIGDVLWDLGASVIVNAVC